MSKFLYRHREIIIPVLFLFFAGSLSRLLLPDAPVWISDSGNKYMIMRNIAAHGSPDFQHLLPELFHFCGFHFQQLANGEIHSFFPPFLAAASVPLWKIAGDASVVFIPMLCGALVLFFTLKLSKSIFPAITLIFTSPLLFYSLQMWEMIPAAAAVTASAYLFQHRRQLPAGIIFGCGVWMREELYLLGAIFGIVLLLQKRYREMLFFALGAAIAVLPLWGVNYCLSGNIFGLHGTGYFSNNRPENAGILLKIRETGFNFYQQIIRFEPQTKFSGILSAAIALAAFAAGCSKKFHLQHPVKVIIIFAGAVIAIILGNALYSAPKPLLVSARTAGLIISFPIMIPLLANWRALLGSSHKNIRLTAAALLIFILIVPFFLNPHDIGLTWGSRHYIVIMPLLALLGCYALRKTCRNRKLRHGLAGFILIAGAVMQLWAIFTLAEVSHKTAALDHYLRALPGNTVVSDLFFLPEMTPHVPQQKLWLEITDIKRTRILLDFLQKEKIPGFTLVLSPEYRRLPNPALNELLKHYPPVSRPQKCVIADSIGLFVVYCAKNP